MLEMLVQSHEGVIELLPAPTDAWKEGSAHGLKARGNVEIDMRWKNGKVTKWKLRSPHRQRVKVLVNGKTHEVKL
jgi:alpha-L-fucosidase 2